MIGFLHVPKAGGTSLRRAFQQAGYRVYRPRGDRYTRRLPPFDRASVDVVTGHIPFDVLTRVVVDELVTVVRDPVERWLSHYFAEAAGRPPGDWPDPAVVPENMTVRMLSSFDRPDLDIAVGNLARFDHIGRTDRLAVTFARYQLPARQERRSPARLRGSAIPRWLHREAAARNPLDIRLYEECFHDHAR